MKVDHLKPPLSIGSVRDGGVYALPPGTELTQTNLFLKVGQIGELFVKTPSERGLNDYRQFVKLSHSNAADLRPLEDAERFENLAAAVELFPDLQPFLAINTDLTHYLAVHKMQYERLRAQNAVGIPQARFGALWRRRLAVFKSLEPAIFQKRIPGATLWQMFDFAALRVTSKWRPCLSVISSQLSELLRSELASHVDWNIQNFVFDQTTDCLFYVDSKPSVFVGRESNEQNLKGIRDYFL